MDGKSTDEFAVDGKFTDEFAVDGEFTGEFTAVKTDLDVGESVHRFVITKLLHGDEGGEGRGG